MEYVGRRVAKAFEGYGTKKFKGTVVELAVLQGYENPFFRIQYDDGDEEDVEEKELLTILVDDKKRKRQGKELQIAETVTGNVPLQNGELAHTANRRTAPNDALLLKSRDRERDAGKKAKSSRGYANVKRFPVRKAAPILTSDATPILTSDATPILTSDAVAAGNLLFISDITHQTLLQGDDVINTPAGPYREQLQKILGILDDVLTKAGIDKKALVSVNVKLKDCEIGMKPFAGVWKRWLKDSPPPAVCVQESFMGSHRTLCAISGVAALP